MKPSSDEVCVLSSTVPSTSTSSSSRCTKRSSTTPSSRKSRTRFHFRHYRKSYTNETTPSNDSKRRISEVDEESQVQNVYSYQSEEENNHQISYLQDISYFKNDTKIQSEEDIEDTELSIRKISDTDNQEENEVVLPDIASVITQAPQSSSQNEKITKRKSLISQKSIKLSEEEVDTDSSSSKKDSSESDARKNHNKKSSTFISKLLCCFAATTSENEIQEYSDNEKKEEPFPVQSVSTNDIELSEKKILKQGQTKKKTKDTAPIRRSLTVQNELHIVNKEKEQYIVVQDEQHSYVNHENKPVPKKSNSRQYSISQPKNNVVLKEKVSSKFLLPPPCPEFHGKKTLVLDLDETLVHSSFKPVKHFDFTIQVEIDGTYYTVYVSKRPFVDEFLEFVSKHFEVVIFTASLSKYANPVCDKLDPNGYISHRLFREHCTYIRGNYIKDMSKIGRDITQSIIVDNSPVCFSLQPENAIGCISWYDKKDDTELKQMVPFLQVVAKEPEVFEVLEEYKTFCSY